MPDFDEQVRRGLGAAADAFHPTALDAPRAGNELVARVHQRQQRRQRLVGAGALSAVALVLAGLTSGGLLRGSTAHRVVAVGDRGGTTTSPAAANVPATTVAGGPSDSTGTSVPSDTPTIAPCPASRCGTKVPPPSTGSPTTARVPPNSSTTVTNTSTSVATTTTLTPLQATILVTESDSGRTFALHVGQRLRITLSGSNAMLWSQPAASDARVLRAQPTGVTAVRGSAIALYVGGAAGQATVTANEDAACRSSTPACMIATIGFRITVNVIP